jgi:hypothetical protein
VKVEFDVQPLSGDNIYDPDIINIYPNPTNGILYISSEKVYHKLDIEIFNQIGKKVMTANNVKSLDLRSLPSGTYFLKIDLNNTLESYKIIKIE